MQELSRKGSGACKLKGFLSGLADKARLRKDLTEEVKDLPR